MTEEEYEHVHQKANEVEEAYEEYAHQAWHAGNDVGIEEGQLILAGAMAQDLANRVHMVQHNSEFEAIAQDINIADAHALLQGATVILHRGYNREWKEQYRMLADLLHDVIDHLEEEMEKDD